ncbi:class I SAM-dependent methyltransferase [Ligilactobacillus acidipiscis]|uniref:class I SAM-dependent methyltransferase n=1 Tax=Ligilactobacillus acidipiscis TaxID=89059 RepID=UPI0023F74429|nr:class I SAM-dependent methyltransferase [Ligilactobacillus acidipiscis]WEV57386.1 class I SAM-dependent methyltransferase [Ligilactobacillus acidipiscis]
MSQISDYHQYVYETPWGKLFYRLLWSQLDHLSLTNKDILDFGSGFGKTAEHFARKNKITAYEPNKEMLHYQDSNLPYLQITGSLENFFNRVGNQKFDYIFIHNVLEYVSDPQDLLTKLKTLLKPDGHFSIVKHNKLGHVFASAVFADKPGKGIEILDQKQMISQSFGPMYIYSLNELKAWLSLPLINVLGIRAVYGLSTNNQVKYTQKWQNTMFQLEDRLSTDPYAKNVAFFQHVIV